MVLLTCSPNAFGVLEYRETPGPRASGGTCRLHRAVTNSSRWAPAGAAPSPLLARVAGWDQQHRPPRKSSFRLKHLSPLTSSLKPRQGHLRPTVGTCRGALAQIQAESFTLTASSNAGKRDSGWGPHLPGFTVQWGRSATKHTDPSISGRYSVEYL